VPVLYRQKRAQWEGTLTLFEQATREGFPATTLWWPATFPARPESPVRTIPGLGTPDILGRLGVGVLFTTDPGVAREQKKTPIRLLQKTGKDRYSILLEGPAAQKRGPAQPSMAALQLDLIDEKSARLAVGKQTIQLSLGVWSPIIEVSFKLAPFYTLRSLTRVLLTQVLPDIRLYFLPLQIHPLSSLWRYATPPSFVKQTWKASGPFLSLGWPEDTTALEEGFLSDSQFLTLCDEIMDNRQGTFLRALDSFHEGVLAVIFDGLDRVQHMFRRDRPDLVDGWYGKLDSLVGQVLERLPTLGKGKAKLLVLSDHGFSEFKYKTHLNRWLIEQGFLSASTNGKSHSLEDVDWSRSQAYAVGLNSLYVNLEKREGQGSVAASQYQPLVASLREKILAWQGPDGRPVASRVLLRDEAFSGPMTPYAPDLVLGFSPGYRASPESGLGQWKDDAIEPNQDHWGADHCIDSQAVPGVFFSSYGLEGLTRPSYRDIPRLAIGKDLPASQAKPPAPPSSTGGESKEIIEERLKSLGYL